MPGRSQRFGRAIGFAAPAVQGLSARQRPPGGIVDRTIREFVEDVAAALPDLIAGLLFLVLAGAAVKLALVVVGRILRRALGDGDGVYVAFVRTVVGVFLWFGVVLSFLSIVGLEGIAAALGTASGFVALGVSYALSGMIADAVAGVYLLRDPDFNPGDTVVTDDVTGTVRSIELRKTRLNVDGDTVVKANSEIEAKWTRKRE